MTTQLITAAKALLNLHESEVCFCNAEDVAAVQNVCADLRSAIDAAEKSCETCKHSNLTMRIYPCVVCKHNTEHQADNWEPK